jgi:hypothetical protein
LHRIPAFAGGVTGTVWGAGSFNINFPANTEQICSTPGGASIFGTSATPIALSPADRPTANNVFDHWGNSLDQYEASPDVSAFSSKFDAFAKGGITLTKDEAASQIAKSPVRLNPDHPSTVFRVRMDNLNPRTTYYYTVESMEANGARDGVKSTLRQFTTP